MEHPKDVGDRSTLAVMLALREEGFAIAIPFGENVRYDLVIDDDTRLARVQCKTGRLQNGAIRFMTSSSYAHHKSPKERSRHYFGQIDCFGVYCPETRGVYLIPIEAVPTTARASLRVDVPRNGQRKRIRLASDYQIGTVEVPRLIVTQGLRASSGAPESCA
jgi:PD-(D/E)XK endonuclease